MPGQSQQAGAAWLEHVDAFADPQSHFVQTMHGIGAADDVDDVGRLAGAKELHGDGVNESQRRGGK